VDRKESDKYTVNGRKAIAKRHQRYKEGIERQIVALYEASDRSAASLGQEYELSRDSVWRWTKQYGAESEADKATVLQGSFNLLIATVIMLVFEVVRIDFVAIICMLALGWTGVVTPQETLSGFSSNAVIAMIAVMIIGQGMTKTGIMDRFSRAVLEKVGTKKSSVIWVMSL
jgi:di/tricarboxylate transporter